MKKTIQAWVIWLSSLALAFAADYFLRLRNSDIHSGGIPIEIQVVFLSIVGIYLSMVLYKATQSFEYLWKRISLVAIQLGLGFSLYALIGIYYVCSTGIDCF